MDLNTWIMKMSLSCHPRVSPMMSANGWPYIVTTFASLTLLCTIKVLTTTAAIVFHYEKDHVVEEGSHATTTLVTTQYEGVTERLLVAHGVGQYLFSKVWVKCQSVCQPMTNCLLFSTTHIFSLKVFKIGALTLSGLSHQQSPLT